MKKLLLGLVTPLALFAQELIPCKVVRVIDGDTFRCVLPDGKLKKVRIVGLDTLETQNMRKGRKQAKWFVGGIKVVKEFGRKAKEFTKAKTLGRVVYLELAPEGVDSGGRLLAYVWLDRDRDELLNEEILKEGLAFLYILPPKVKYVSKLAEAQEEAYEEKKGFWKYFKLNY
ncbi:thermonuclease family protein [Aquifex sp.]